MWPKGQARRGELSHLRSAHPSGIPTFHVAGQSRWPVGVVSTYPWVVLAERGPLSRKHALPHFQRVHGTSSTTAAAAISGWMLCRRTSLPRLMILRNMSDKRGDLPVQVTPHEPYIRTNLPICFLNITTFLLFNVAILKGGEKLL